MKFSINKAKATAIIVTILMMASMTLTVLPAQAQFEGETAHGGQPVAGYEGPTTIPAGQTADFTIDDLAFLSVSPNPIGVGQELLVNVWITFPSGEGKYMVGYTVTITKPDGSTEDIRLKSYVADGTSWFTYVPQQVGQWKFKFTFAGEYFPAGYWDDGQYSATRTGAFSNAIFNPSVYCTPSESPETILTVQPDFVESWQSPLPTDYWTRPIMPNNREWRNIAGNYPWESFEGSPTAASDKENYYGPYVIAPNTPHFLWKEQTNVAGIIGGEAQQYSSLSSPGTPNVIFMGRCYQTKTIPINGVPTSCAVSFDLRTGQIYYAIPTAQGGITPTRIAYWRGVDTAVPGAGEATGIGGELIHVASNRLYKINPLTGAVTVNISLPSMGSTPGGLDLFYRNGYYLAFQKTADITETHGNITTAKAAQGFFINWTAQGSSSNFNSRIISNVSAILPRSYRTLYQIGSYGNLGAYDPEAGITVNQNRFIYGGFYGSSYEAVDVTTGQLLWNISTPVALMESAYRPTNAWARHGRYIAEMERGYWQARDLRTGNILWETEMDDYPWGEFWLYDLAAYENLVIGVGYTGVWALDEVTGDVAWHYVDPAISFETPYNNNATTECYAVQTIRIADGKVYVTNSEHTPTQPATRGWGMICLDVLTGEFLWKIRGANLNPGAAADGYLTASSSYSGTFYVIGKGQSKTTVEAPKTTVAVNSKVLIQGTVLDMSPAQPGTPCVADEAMDVWMDYLHHQMPSDGYFHNVTVTGVPVMLTAIDSNGNPINIGTTTSDNVGAYQIEWTPATQGLYKIHAVFAGSDSYGSSVAETGLSVGPAPTTTQPPASEPPIDYTWTIIGAAIAIIIVVILVGVLIMMRKR